MIENEQWVHVEVPVDFQQMLNEITKSAANDDEGEEDHRADLLKKQSSENSLYPDASVSSAKKGNSDLSKTNNFLKVAGQDHFVVGFMLLVIKATHDYMQVANNVPSLTTDVLHRIFDLLKVIFLFL